MKLPCKLTVAGLVLVFSIMNAAAVCGGEIGSQFLIGFTSLNEDEIDFDQIEGVEGFDLKDKMNLSDLVSIGGTGYSNLSGEKNSLGVEYGAIFSGMADDVNSETGNGQVSISADGSLMLLDLFLGMRANSQISEKVRLYGGVGPLLMFGYVSCDFEQENMGVEEIDISEHDSALGIGGYVRLGAEFSISRDSALGVGARWFTASLDFNNTLGEADIEGPQLFFNYTSRF